MSAAATVSPPRRWRQRGPLLVLRRAPDDVEVLAARLRDPAEAVAEIARVKVKAGVTPGRIERLRRSA